MGGFRSHNSRPNLNRGLLPMIQVFDAAARTFAALSLGALVLAGPTMAFAADAAPSPAVKVAQADATTAPSATAGKAKPRRSRADRVEDRINHLHDVLKITPDQETPWKAVADAMRADSQDMQAVIADRRAHRGDMSAVDDLRNYQKVAETHVQGLQRLIPAFQTLYDGMSPDQKKNADEVFGKHRHARKAHAGAPQPKPQQ
jgi:periplasmic protein CpxP/Spy